MHEPVRVLIVDDSAFMRRAVERMLVDSPAIRVVATASNGEEAVELACEQRPDVIVMDVNMPRMDGLEALERVMRTCPTPVLMMSTLTRAGARVTIRALELGAVDFLDKSEAGTAMDIHRLAPLLRDKVLAVAQADVGDATARKEREEHAAPAEPAVPMESRARRLEPVSGAGAFEIIAIGASTGGPRALTEVLPRLPAELSAGVVVAQHMPPGFTCTLAERLDEASRLTVREAADGDLVKPGTALLAPGGKQLLVERRNDELVVRVTPGPSRLLHHPSVDVLFESVAAATGPRAIGVVLTGMGEDGAAGLQAMRDAGAVTLVESQETAIIYGMPRAARPAARRILPLYRIAAVLEELCSNVESQPMGKA